MGGVTALYAWLVTSSDWVSFLVYAGPVLLSVSLGYWLAFSYGLYRFYGLPLTEEWLKIPLGRLALLGAVGVLGALAVLWVVQQMGIGAGQSDLAEVGLSLGFWVLGPTLVSLPVGYVVGALVSPEG